MSCSDDPFIADERAAARNSLGKQTLFDDGCHPWVTAKLGVVTADYSEASSIHLSTLRTIVAVGLLDLVVDEANVVVKQRPTGQLLEAVAVAIVVVQRVG